MVSGEVDVLAVMSVVSTVALMVELAAVLMVF